MTDARYNVAGGGVLQPPGPSHAGCWGPALPDGGGGKPVNDELVCGALDPADEDEDEATDEVREGPLAEDLEDEEDIAGGGRGP